jgi:hypothetical protein
MQPDALETTDKNAGPSAPEKDRAQVRRTVRVPYRSFGALRRSDASGNAGDDGFAAWADGRNRRLAQLAAGRPFQPPASAAISEQARSEVNNRSANNDLLNRMRRSLSDAPSAASGPVAVPANRRGLRVPVVYAADLPPERHAGQHPWVRTPALPSLGRRSFPSLVVLMILVWAVVLGAGIYKGLKPPSGFIIANDRW